MDGVELPAICYFVLFVLILIAILLIWLANYLQELTNSQKNNFNTLNNTNIEKANKINSKIKKTEKMVQSYTAAFITSVVLVFVTALLLLAFAIVRNVEQDKLFCPTLVHKYKDVNGSWIPLKSGGGLMHCTPDAPPNSRKLLFLHGNTGNLDLYDKALRKCAAIGYNIYALEYAGYGITVNKLEKSSRVKNNRHKFTRTKANAKTVLRDVLEAWAVCGDENCSVMGFSLGGAILGQIYDKLRPMPAQLIFLNTFHSFPSMLSDKLGFFGTLASGLVATQWSTKSPKFYHNRVLVVYTKDDDVVPPQQGQELCEIFKVLKPDCVELPTGGHRYSTIQHLDKWATTEHLLSPIIDPSQPLVLH